MFRNKLIKIYTYGFAATASTICVTNFASVAYGIHNRSPDIMYKNSFKTFESPMILGSHGREKKLVPRLCQDFMELVVVSAFAISLKSLCYGSLWPFIIGNQAYRTLLAAQTGDANHFFVHCVLGCSDNENHPLYKYCF